MDDRSAVERLEACLAEIDRRGADVDAYAFVRPADELRAEAAAADARRAAGRPLSPVDGLAVGLKDLIDTAGVPTECGSPALAGRVPAEDAPVVARLKAAGAVITGKLRTHEFAMGSRTPPTRNPLDLGRSPGGSSGGSGAALAARMCDGAIGTDTGGSIRKPASYNGVVGLKPTQAAVPMAGIFPLAPSLDTCGPMARDVATTAALFLAIADAAGLARPGAPRPLRVAVPVGPPWDVLQPEVAAALGRALDAMRSLGWTVEEIRLPATERSVEIQLGILVAEAAAAHDGLWQERGHLYGPDARRYVEMGLAATALSYLRAVEGRKEVRAEIRAALARADLLVSATTPFTAPPLEATEIDVGGRVLPVDLASVPFCCPFIQADVPALSLPCGRDRDGLPAGIQLVGRPLGDLELLRAAAELEPLLAG